MAEPKKEKKTKKPVRTPALEELTPMAQGALGASAAADPFLERNEFKKRFYNQLSQPAIDAETMYGKGTKRGFEYPTVDPDTKMMQDAQGMAEGGSVRGQKNIQVKKKQFRGIF
jgi:hypothetical protein